MKTARHGLETFLSSIMKVTPSLCSLLCFAVAILASAATDDSHEDHDAYGTTEGPFEFTTELDSTSRDLAERDPRCLILVGIFGFFVTTLIGTFGFVPKLLSSGIIQQLIVLVIGKQTVSYPTLPHPNVPHPTLPPPPLPSSTPIPIPPKVEPPPPAEVEKNVNINGELHLQGEEKWEKMPVQEQKVQASGSLMVGLWNWKISSSVRAYGANAKEKMQAQRYAAYKAGYTVELQAPKTVRLYRTPPLRRSCNAYLRSITQETNELRGKLLGNLCVETIKRKN